MNLEIYCVSENENLIGILKKIEENKHGFAIVLNSSGQAVGTLTDGDVRRALINGYYLDTQAYQIMQKRFKYIHEDSSMNNIIQAFKSADITFLPILNKQFYLVNVITKKQFYAFLLQDFQFDINFNFFSMDERALDQEIYEKPWGIHKTTFLTDYSRAKVLIIYPGEELSLQSHLKREEHWVVVKGKAKMTIAESERILLAGDYIFIPKSCRHKVTNLSNQENLIICEIQLGDYFGEDDIIRYDDKYGRI